MHLIYIDDSKDPKTCIYSAMVIHEDDWMEAFRYMRSIRKELKQSDGIYVQKELHAWKFVSGRGQIAPDVVTKSRRIYLFSYILQCVSQMPGLQLFNACFPRKQEERAFERLLNRINRTMQAWDSRAILICDEGKENALTRLSRKMHVYNPIPSSSGTWTDTGKKTKNITLERIIEDPFFKQSDHSYFIQIADFIAYSLLRRESPIPSRKCIEHSFDILKPILITKATRKDPEGILRP
ncbi:DUF3800 domain-containing protein [bacterium]|nr:DUF3800 domain-containing protein [bacterium]